jgi:uncharacterized protein YqeY
MIEQLKNDLKTAMKARDAVTVGVLRMVISDLHNRKIAAGDDLSDEQIVAALKTGVKQRHDAAQQFAAGGRQDRADTELAEVEVIKGYLPDQLEGDELVAAIDGAIAASGATSPGDMGKVMAQLMSQHQGRIDGKSANALVRERLAAV